MFGYLNYLACLLSFESFLEKYLNYLPFLRDDNLVEHVLVADVLKLPKGVVHRKAGLLGVHAEVLVRRGAGENLVLQHRIVVQVLKRRQKHFLGGVRVDGVDAAAEAFHLVETVRNKDPHAAVGVRRHMRFRCEKCGHQRGP